MSGVGLCRCGCGEATLIAKQTRTSRGWVKGEPLRFIYGHHQRVKPRRPPLESFLAKVDKTDTCWLWTGATRPTGYGQFWLNGQCIGAHRAAYLLLVGPIPEGLQLDHLCRTPRCVNPAHLEPVTQLENTMRGESFAVTNALKTHCPNGHPYSIENTLHSRTSGRICRICRRAREASYKRARRATS